jgi:hypothetical protein
MLDPGNLLLVAIISDVIPLSSPIVDVPVKLQLQG